MRPIVTDVPRSVCLFDTTVSPTKTDEPIDGPVNWGGPKGPCVGCGSTSPAGRGTFGGKWACTDVSVRSTY